MWRLLDHTNLPSPNGWPLSYCRTGLVSGDDSEARARSYTAMCNPPFFDQPFSENASHPPRATVQFQSQNTDSTRRLGRSHGVEGNVYPHP